MTSTEGSPADPAPSKAPEDQTDGRPGPACSACGGATRFADGHSTHDLWAERYVCNDCGRDTYRSFGRGSVS